MFASPTRLDFAITVGTWKPKDIEDVETILSGPLPIRIHYKICRWAMRRLRREPEPTDTLRRLRNALTHHDRVREISLEVLGDWWDQFFKETTCLFPALESLVLRFGKDSRYDIPDTFLGGPDPSIPHLRHLRLQCASLASISGFLLSATALTDFFLDVETAFGQSPGTSLLACLQSMLCLHHLDLRLSREHFDPPSYYLATKDIVPLPQLTCIHYIGHVDFLEALVAGLSAPSLLDVDIDFSIEHSIVHLHRFINEINEHYHTIHMVFRDWNFQVSFLTQPEYISQCKPHFQLGSLDSYPVFLEICDAVSTRLATVQELCVSFEKKIAGVTIASIWEDLIPWCRLLRKFPCVKALRTEGINNYSIARSLLQDEEEPDDDTDFMPADRKSVV